MASAPIYAATPKLAHADLTSATGATEFGTSAPTNLSSLLTAGVNGSYLRRIKAKNRGTSSPTANIIRVFLVVGGSYKPIFEFDITAGATPSATVKSQDSDWHTLDLSIPSGHSVYVGETVANSVCVTCEYGDY